MKLIDSNNSTTNNIVAAKIIAMTKKIVTVQTQDGQYLQVPLSQQKRTDSLFVASLKDIWHAGIWIPVNKKLHQLLKYDWFDNSVANV